MVTPRTIDAFKQTISWMRIWGYILGGGLLSIGVTAVEYEWAILASAIVFFISICLHLSYVLTTKFERRYDEYAASVHRSGIEHFFAKQPSNSTVDDSIAEIMQRTTFARPDTVRPIVELYQSLTFALILTVLAVLSYLLISPSLVLFLAFCGFVIYLTDIWFGIRSSVYFKMQESTLDDVDSTHLETISELFAEQLSIQKPQIRYSENTEFLAGEINAFFMKPQLFVSKQLLEQPQHIQTGILAHEIAHMYIDKSTVFSHRYSQLLLPLLYVVFAMVPLSLFSISGLFVGLVVTMIIIAIVRHRDEFLADKIATELTHPEFVILSILEFSAHNPFIDEFSWGTKFISRLAHTHPLLEERIERLTSYSGQKFNSSEKE